MMKSMRAPSSGTVLGGPEVPSMESEFPYGLRIELNEDSIKALGITKLPDVGTVLELEARVVVKASGSCTIEGKGVCRNISLQITDMDLEGISKEKDSATIVYTEDN